MTVLSTADDSAMKVYAALRTVLLEPIFNMVLSGFFLERESFLNASKGLKLPQV